MLKTIWGSKSCTWGFLRIVDKALSVHLILAFLCIKFLKYSELMEPCRLLIHVEHVRSFKYWYARFSISLASRSVNSFSLVSIKLLARKFLNLFLNFCPQFFLHNNNCFGSLTLQSASSLLPISSKGDRLYNLKVDAAITFKNKSLISYLFNT